MNNNLKGVLMMDAYKLLAEMPVSHLNDIELIDSVLRDIAENVSKGNRLVAEITGRKNTFDIKMKMSNIIIHSDDYKSFKAVLVQFLSQISSMTNLKILPYIDDVGTRCRVYFGREEGYQGDWITLTIYVEEES